MEPELQLGKFILERLCNIRFILALAFVTANKCNTKTRTIKLTGVVRLHDSVCLI